MTRGRKSAGYICMYLTLVFHDDFWKKDHQLVTHCNQLVFVIAILTLCVRSVENIELCQKMTIKNCASNFHEVFSSL